MSTDSPRSPQIQHGANYLRQPFRQGRAMVSYMMAGYPTPTSTLPLLTAITAGGTDVIELGVPYSEPVADGPEIANAAQVSIQQGTTLSDIFEWVQLARAEGCHTPIVLMGYYQSFYHHGLERCVEQAVSSGIDGFLVVDLPLGLGETYLPPFVTLVQSHGLAMIPLVSPTTPNSRLNQLAKWQPAWVYVVAVNGITGTRRQVTHDTCQLADRVRAETQSPIAVGFGISQPEHAQTIWQHSQGVVVGSAIIRLIRVTFQQLGSLANHTSEPWYRVTEFIQHLTQQKPKTVLARLTSSPSLDLAPPTTPSVPDTGNFGEYGGQYLPESLMAAHQHLAEQYQQIRNQPSFQRKLHELLRDYVGRPTPLYRTRRLVSQDSLVEIYLKREDLCFTGSHKLNNALAQALLAQQMGCQRIVAETGAGQHGVATATACSLLGLPCVVYMGETDLVRQARNVTRMKLLGATVIAAQDGSGGGTLKHAINDALRDWVTHVTTTYYLIGSAVGAHPYPTIVRDFQAVIGQEARGQFLAQAGTHPDLVVACVGGGSNALGIFQEYLDRSPPDTTQLVGVEPEGAASLTHGTPGVLHGSHSLLLQTHTGQVAETQSLSAGLDYPGVSPVHAWLKHTDRVQYHTVTDDEALEAFHQLNRREGIPAALESAHAVAWALRRATTHQQTEPTKTLRILVNLSGRGDKDLDQVSDMSSNRETERDSELLRTDVDRPGPPLGL